MLRLFPYPGYCKYCCDKHGIPDSSLRYWFHSLGYPYPIRAAPTVISASSAGFPFFAESLPAVIFCLFDNSYPNRLGGGWYLTVVWLVLPCWFGDVSGPFNLECPLGGLRITQWVILCNDEGLRGTVEAWSPEILSSTTQGELEGQKGSATWGSCPVSSHGSRHFTGTISDPDQHPFCRWGSPVSRDEVTEKARPFQWRLPQRWKAN